jgi:hypothetical protein
LSDWLPLRDKYLSELIKLEAPPLSKKCESCSIADIEFHCVDCFPRLAICKACCRQQHLLHPFHRVELWNGKCFVKSDLHSLGISLHLGHGGGVCHHNQDVFDASYTSAEYDSILFVVHSNGIHQRRFRYCRCPGAPDHALQLLQHHLFPSTFKQPQTVFTFDVLDNFYIDAMECKTSAGSFYSKLRRFTSSIFPDDVPVRQFMFFMWKKII